LKEDIAGALLAGSSVIKNATLLGVSKVTVSKVMWAYKCHHGKTTLVKRNSGQKSALTKRDHNTLRRIVSKSDRTTAVQVTAELNIDLEDPVSTKTVWCELHKSNIHARAVIVKPLITEINAQMLKQ
jgi:transposase